MVPVASIGETTNKMAVKRVEKRILANFFCMIKWLFFDIISTNYCKFNALVGMD
jgi:hypothetical protein